MTMPANAHRAPLPVDSDLREQTIRRLLNATKLSSAVETEQAIEEIVHSLPMPVAIEDVESECGPRVIAVRVSDDDTSTGAEIAYLAGRPWEPTLNVFIHEDDLSLVGSGEKDDFTFHAFEVRRPDALRDLATTLLKIADAADARGVFWPLREKREDRASAERRSRLAMTDAGREAIHGE